MKRRIYLVSHTHWDREWYLPFEQFRTRLVDLIDGVIQLLQARTDYHSFMLDGQTVLLEDYLQVRPENRDILEELVRTRRLIIGPWYVLPDEYLISGEAHVRNLLIGKRLGAEFGGWLP